MLKKCISILICSVILLQMMFTTACVSEREKTKFNQYYFDYFDTATVITGYFETKEEFDIVCDDIEKQLEEYHKLYDIYYRYDGINNLVTINDVVDGEHKEVQVDDKIIDMLLFAKEMYNKTDGMVNVAMGSVLRIWHNYRSRGIDDPQDASLPKIEKLREAAKHTDIDDVIVDTENKTVFLADPEMRLDVGAIAKGYTVERIAENLENKGITSIILNVGGNIRTIGLNGQNEPFKAGIENPDKDNKEVPHIEYLELTDMAVVTSGSYQRFYTVDGVNYHHIIDPETLMPGTNFKSVSVVTDDSGLGDALSTALFLMDEEEGRNLIESIDNAEVMWVLNDGSQHYSSGFSDYTFEYNP